MTLQELLRELEENGLRPDFDYVINKPHVHEDSFRLSEKNGKWFVTYMERGKERLIDEFESEETAYRGFLKVLVRNR